MAHPGVAFLRQNDDGVQFQSAAALGPLIRQTFGVGLPDLGLLIACLVYAAFAHLARRRDAA